MRRLFTIDLRDYDDEDRIDSLIREVREEAGLVVVPETVREYGSVLRRQNSDRDKNTIFEQENYYYFCDVRDENIGQDLDSYEEKLRFTLSDVDIDEAIRVNDEYNSDNAFDYHMIKRELRVLWMLKEEFFRVCFRESEERMEEVIFYHVISDMAYMEALKKIESLEEM